MDGAAFDPRHDPLAPAEPQDAPWNAPEEAPGEPVALIGAACRLPGAPDLAALIRLLADGRDAVSDIPEDRWTKAQFLHPERGQPGKAYTFAAGVIDRVYDFDPGFFGISPREAAQMDPQQRLLLELAQEAFEDAGLRAADLAGSRTGVYVGGSSWDYTTLHTGDPSVTDAYSMTGSTLCSLANRISYAFDLHGPSFTVDTACSSSLVALHLACEAIRQGQIGMAVVGGVNLLLAPQSYIGFCRASMLSPNGRCHAFDRRADGYVRAEGGGVVVLKPLSRALADGDVIRAVVRGTGVNSDGRTTGLSLPNQVAQAALLREVYGRFRIHPDELAYLEAHGTGTPAGDPIEAGALGEVLGGARRAPLPIGSVKTNLGHLEAGSGMAGLLKAVIALQTRRVPASLHCETPNPAIPFDALNLRLLPQALPLAADRDHAVGINSFGFGGTNAHAVLGSAPAPAPVPPGTETTLPPLLLSARSDGALRALAALWRDRLRDLAPDAAVPALRAAARLRDHHPVRLVVLGDTPAELADSLEGFLAGRDSAAVITGQAVGRDVAFAFSGNGSQWAGMAADALAYSPLFARALRDVDAVLQPLLGWSVCARLQEADTAVMRNTAIAQPLLFAVQVAAVQALDALGLRPAACFGHSVGEVAAAWAAGALSLEQAAHVITCRSTRQQQTAGQGRMAVLALPVAQAEAALAELDAAARAGLAIAADNSSTAVTVAGPEAGIAALEALAQSRKWGFTRLDLDYAFHSAAMEPIRAPLLGDLQDLAPRHAGIRLVSTVSGTRIAGPELDAEYWWRNVRDPVRFAEAARHVVADGARILLEIGPQPVLQAYLHDALRAEDAGGRVLSTLGRRKAARDPFLIAAARCHVAGWDLSRAAIFDGAADGGALPHYPWQRDHYKIERTLEATDTLATVQDHALLGFRRATQPDDWFAHLSLAAQPWLGDHVVGGSAVLPAAAIIDMLLGAARARHPGAPALEIGDLEITRAVVLEPGTLRETRVRIRNASGDVEFASRPRLAGDGWTVHATGRVAAGAGPQPVLRHALPSGAPARRLDAAALYALTEKLGLDYGPEFRAVDRIDVFGQEAVLHLRHGDAALARAESGYRLDPALLDGALQGLVALASDRLGSGDSNTAVLPWRFGRVRLLRPDGVLPDWAHLRIVHAGPRALCADFRLLDANGAAVAELIDCWFVSVRLGTKRDPAESSFRFDLVAVPDATRPSAAAALLETALASLPAPAGPSEMEALAEAAALSFARDALIAEPASLDPDLHMRLEHWLAAEGVADADDLPPADAILQSLLFDAPAAAADVALLARAGEDLPRRLRDAAPPAPAPAALLDQFLYASPSGLRALDALAAAAAGMARDWPRGQVLRVLAIGAGHGGFSRALLRRLRGTGAALHYVAEAEPDALPGLQEALRTETAAGISASVRALGSDDGSRFDLVLGTYALSVSAQDAARLHAQLAPGGVLLAVEPLPNRVWSLLKLPAPRAAADWQADLSNAGFLHAAARDVESGLWPIALLGAAVSQTVPEAAPEPSGIGSAGGKVLLIAAPGSGWADASAAALREQGLAVQITPPGGVPDIAGFESILILPEARTMAQAADWLAVVAALAEPLSANPLPLTLGLRAAPAGDAFAAAITGLRRVLANEAPDIACRVVRLGPDLPDVEAASRLIREMRHPDAEAEIAWTATGRLAPRARPGLPQPASLSGDAVLGVAKPGLLDTLGWQAATPRALGDRDVSIDVRAAGLNFRDVMWAMGLLPDEALLHGFAGPTLGLECAGVVREVGADVQDLRPGDRVMAFAPASLATSAVTSRHAVVKLPDNIGFAAAATVPVAFLTTAYALGTLARLAPGERVLIHGGAGGVGLAAIQYAAHRGAEIFATAGSETKRALLRQLGVAHVLDSRSLSFADEVMAITGGEGLDVVLNSLSGEAMDRSLRLLKPFGRFLELGKRDFYENTSVGLRPLRHNVSYFAIDADQLPNNRPLLAAELLAEIAGLIEQGAIRPLPYREFGFEDAVEAFRLMQGAGHIGKIVLTPPEQGLHVPVPAPGFAARADGTYVVSGGLSGFGLETARFLADHGARHLALLSRRGAGAPDAEAAIAGFAARGVVAEAIACDVGDAAAVQAALDHIRATMPPIRGVVHAAMVMDDAFLPSLDAPRFAASLAPKWGGADNLDRLTRQDPVELFLLFSSITTALGNPGQGNYVAANAAIEAVAERRQAEGLPALAVGWGPIADVGYLARTADVSEALTRRLGSGHATAAEALAVLPALLASGEAVVMQADIAWGAARAGLKLLGSPIFAGLAGGGADAEATTDLRALLAGKTAEEARTIVAGLLAEEIGTILKLAADRIDPARPLTELGMDSLMAVELRLAAETRFGVSLPLFSLAEGATLNALATRIAKPLIGEAEAAPAEEPAASFLARYEPQTPAELALVEEIEAVPDRPSYAAQAQNTV